MTETGNPSEQADWAQEIISRLANADVPADVRESITSHSSDEIHRRYVHLETATQRRAIDLLPSLGEDLMSSERPHRR